MSSKSVRQSPDLRSLGEAGSSLPSVTCLCPTYGRFERLRDAVACFLLQDYPGEKRLLIANDAREQVRPTPDRKIWYLGVDVAACGDAAWDRPMAVCNLSQRAPTLGHKREWLLRAAATPLVAHWDDDDLYLPWHLTLVAMRLVGATGITCAKPAAAWWVLGPRHAMTVRGIRHNIFEGQMLFRRERGLELGGYPPKDSGQARDLLRAFGRAGEAEVWNPPDDCVSYVYRWGDGVDHVSARKGQGHDQNFGDGQPLIPADDAMAWARERLRDQFRQLAAGCAAHLDREGWDTFTARLRTAVASDLAVPTVSQQGADLSW